MNRRLRPCRNLGQNEASGLENEGSGQECAPRRNRIRSGSSAQLIEAGAEVAMPTSMDLRQEFRLHEGPMPSLSSRIVLNRQDRVQRGRTDSNVEHGSSWEKSFCKSLPDKLSLRSRKQGRCRTSRIHGIRKHCVFELTQNDVTNRLMNSTE